MNARQETKLNDLINNYRNGNRADAAATIRKLTKAELVFLLVNDHRLPDGFVGDRECRYDFQRFVDRAVGGWDE